MAVKRNSTPKVETYTPTQVIDEIYRNTEQGMGIVPLFGSGLSAASGIPAGIDYRAYLFYCLARVFGTDGETDRRIDQWDPRTLRWPDITEIPLYHNVSEAMRRWAQKQLEEVEGSPLGYHDARWQAAGAVADWRAMLHLLSRLTLQESEHGDGEEVVQTYPDQRIIDSFFVHLTNNRRPNSAYLLLAHLADILRVKIILTTNFDNLIESAFQSFSMPVAVYDVHMDAHLPDADFVRAQRSIIKIHGGRYGLRADFSLDKYPTADDVEKFIAYLSLYDKNYVHINQNQRNLLVMGVSGNERRTIALICHALNNLKQLRVFWICHRERETAGIFNSFSKTLKVLCSRDEITSAEMQDCLRRLKITVFPSPALFLLELYQKIFLSLPPAGVKFPVVWTMPPRLEGTLTRRERKSLQRVQGLVEKSGPIISLGPQRRPIVLSAHIHHALSENLHCIWVNLHDPLDSYDLAFVIIEAIARELGIMNLLPISVKSSAKKNPLPKEFGSQIRLLVQNAVRRLAIFINCSELTDAGDNQSVRSYLKSLQSDHISYVLVDEPTRGIRRFRRPAARNSQLQKSLDRTLANSWRMGGATEREYNARSFMVKKIHGMPEVDIQRFILALTLFRYPCYLSVLHTWACIKAPESLSTEYDNDSLRNAEAQVFTRALMKQDLVQESVGQFVHIPRADRAFLRLKIKELKPPGGLSWSFYEAECHQGIADWYMKLYRASGDIRAVFECMFHRLECYRLAGKSGDTAGTFRLRKTSLIEGEQAVQVIAEDIDTLYHSFALGHLFATIGKQLQNLQNKAPHDWFGWKLAWLFYHLQLIQIHYERQIGRIPIKEEKRLLDVQEPLADPALLDIHLMDIFKDNAPAFLDALRTYGIKKSAQAVPTEEWIKQLYEKIGQHIHRREYDRAEELTADVLRYLGFDISIPRNWRNAGTTEILRSAVRLWIEGVQTKVQGLEVLQAGGNAETEGLKQELALRLCQELFKIMIRILRRKQSMEFHRAQIVAYSKGSPLAVRRLLQSAEITYMYSTEIMRYISDTTFLNRENAYLRTSTGLILAKMNRHHEAYRRYNESYGYLNFIPLAMQSEYVAIDLNRGETFLHLLARNAPRHPIPGNPKPSSYLKPRQKPRLGYLFDAIASVERAESRLQGTTVNNWLYSRICEMQLTICLETVKLRHEISKTLGQERVGPQKDKYDLFSRCRECEICGTRFTKNLQDGLQMVGDDALRMARYMELSLWFMDEVHRSGQHSHNSRLDASYGTEMVKGRRRLIVMSRHPPSEEVGRYVKKVLKKIIHKKKSDFTL
jgi:hypothetical protein